ncbi:sensor histidine kinase [Streptomyces avicenniae]|uniref:sensor histidine kinase n=1 Tax=Streptomyces avicenniae TaxID=500153 RepID=UPI00069981DB|nr:HAMP domain-containing sensor histidine kinase [Streptomyces avicenniae]
MGSVRARTALGATAVVALALFAAGLLMLSTLQDNLGHQVSLQAEVTARDVAGRLVTDTEIGDLDLGIDAPVQVVDRDSGTLLAATDGLESIRGTGTEQVVARPADPPPAQDRPAADPSSPSTPGDDDDDDDGGDDDGDDDNADDSGDDSGDAATADGGTGLAPGEVADDIQPGSGSAVIDGESRDYRFVGLDLTTPRGVDVVVWAGAPLSLEEVAVSSVRNSMITGFPFVLVVVAAVTWLMTRRAFRPVEGIRREMNAITHSGDLSRRVPQPSARDEIGRLAETTNETLAALEASVERQRRFVADASHELRSPIASLRTQLEVGQAHPELLDVPGAVQDTVRLQALAADLLLLARLDAGERPAGKPVPVGALVADEVAQRLGDRHPIRVLDPVGGGEDETGPVVSGSRTQLARVLGNLLDNAQRHAASAVRVAVLRRDGYAVVEVADDGAGVPEEDRERIFQRFVRLDDARSRDEGGAGLGLAIARDVAERHGGGLDVTTAPEGGALFTLRVPLASPRQETQGLAGPAA